MADPSKWSHPRSSAPNVAQLPQGNYHPPGVAADQFHAPKAGMMPPGSGNPMNNPGQSPQAMGPPQPNQGPPPHHNCNPMGQRPVGQPHGGPERPPGHFGAAPFQPTSATPPPHGSGPVRPQGNLPRSSSFPKVPPSGQVGQGPTSGQPMVNGLPHGRGFPRPPYSQHNGQSQVPPVPGQQYPNASGMGPTASMGPTTNASIGPPQVTRHTQGPPNVGVVNNPTSAPPRMIGVSHPGTGFSPQPSVSVANSSMASTRPAGPAAVPPPSNYRPSPPRQTVPPSSTVPPQPGQDQNSGRPNELPLPYHGYGNYTHEVTGHASTPGLTPNSSEPPSQKSSRAPSPVPGQKYDALEGQFSPQGGSTPGQDKGPAEQPWEPPTFTQLGQQPQPGQPQQPNQFQPPTRPMMPQPGMPMSGQPPPLGVQGQPAPGLQGQPPPPGMQGPPLPPGAPGPPPTGGQGQPHFPGAQMRPSFPGGQMQPPLPGGQMQPPLPGGQMQPPLPGGQMQPPLPGGQMQPPLPGGQMQPPLPGGQMQPPLPGGQMQPPLPGGQMQPPLPGGQMQPPLPGGQMQPPLPGGQMQPPLPGGPMQPSIPGGQSDPSSTAQGPGIMGRRHYPQMPTSMPGPVPGGAPQPTMPTYPMNNNMTGATSQPSPVYPGNSTYPAPNNTSQLNTGFSNMKLQPDLSGPINLLQEKNILPPGGVESPKPDLPTDYKRANCHPDVFRCTLNAIPNTQSLLSKSRLPLGILIHPFKDLAQLPVIQSSVIVRCRSCRTYINPFVTFVDSRRWKCNLCYRNNDLPEEFNYDPVSKTYGEPQRRPEIKSGTIEFIAPSEYMLRPPQPACYLFVLDVSFNARGTGYLQAFCQTLLDELDRLPGDARTQIGFIAFDRSLYYFNLAEGLSQPQLLVVSDVDEIFLPAPDNLLVNLHESKELIIELLNILPNMFKDNMETGSALGPALEASYKLMGPTGGRVSVFQTQLPSVGNGALKSREDPNERSGKKIQHLGPATDFYKRLALDCSAQQLAVDLFMLNSQYSDLASIACIAKYSGGTLHYFPGYHNVTNPTEAERFESVLRRYISRKIGFEAVMRIRCSRGLSIHTFHGNFFVRSTDLLSLPNVNPDAAFGMQMSIEDTIEANYVCFQAALLYTSSKGERRIRVHTLAVPITNTLSEVHAHADQQGIVGLLSKMAVDKSLSSSMGDARDALLNAAIDMLGSYGNTLTSSQRLGQLPCPHSLRLQPLYISAMLKSMSFRVGSSTKLDDRVFSMEQCKNMPLCFLIMMIYPNLYPVHNLEDKHNAVSMGDSVVPQPPLLQLSSAYMDRHGVYLLDRGSNMVMWVGAAVSDNFCSDVFDRPNFSSLPDAMLEIPELENHTSDLIRTFINHLNDQRPYPASLLVLREDSKSRHLFLNHMVEDHTESTMSYYEFLQHLQKEVRS